MSPQSILIGQIIIVLATIVCGVWLSTQWVAAQFSYDAYLGPAWFLVGETPVYYPWRLFEWWYAFDAYAPGVFARGGAIAAGSGFLGAFVAAIGSVWRGRQAKNLTTYGSSRWAAHPVCSSLPAFFLGASMTTIFVMTVQNMSWRSPRRDPARASGS